MCPGSAGPWLTSFLPCFLHLQYFLGVMEVRFELPSIVSYIGHISALRTFPGPEVVSPAFSPYQSCQGLPSSPPFAFPEEHCHKLSPHSHFPNRLPVSLLDVAQVTVSNSKHCALKGASLMLCAFLSIFQSFLWLHPNFPYGVLWYFSFL